MFCILFRFRTSYKSWRKESPTPDINQGLLSALRLAGWQAGHGCILCHGLKQQFLSLAVLLAWGCVWPCPITVWLHNMTASVQVQSHLHCSPVMAILNTCNLRAPLPWLLSDSSQAAHKPNTLLSQRFLVVLQVSQSCCPGTRTYCSGYLVYKLLVITACSQKLVLDDKVQSQMLSLFWLHQYQNFLSFPYHESGAKKIYLNTFKTNCLPFCIFF